MKDSQYKFILETLKDICDLTMEGSFNMYHKRKKLIDKQIKDLK